MTTSKERVDDLTEYVKSGDVASAGVAAHSLKGSAGIILAERLSQLAERIEIAGKLQDFSTVESVLGELVNEVEACHCAILQCKQKMERANLEVKETRVGERVHEG